MAGERTLPGIGLTGFWDLGSAYKDAMDVNLRLLSALVQPRVLSILAAAPGTPTNGDIHIASAAWGGGAANDIMIRDNGAWVAVTPMAGWTVWNVGTSERLEFDGSAWAAIASGGGSSWYDIRLAFTTTPTAGQIIDTIPVIRALTLPANLTGAIGTIGTNPTTSMVLTLKDDGTDIATITISTAGAFTFATAGGTEKVVAAGSILTLVGPGTADATAANAAITIPGVA